MLEGVTNLSWFAPPADLSGVPLTGVNRMVLDQPEADGRLQDARQLDSSALTSFLRSETRPARLETLEVFGAGVSEETAELICALSCLRKFSISFCSWAPGWISQSLSRHRTLRSLEISDYGALGDEDLLALGDMESLEALALKRCVGVTDAGFARLGRLSRLVMCEPCRSRLDGSFLGRLAGLRTLLLRSERRRAEQDPSSLRFLRCLKDLPLLEEVDVDGSIVRAGDLVHPGLKVLKIPCGNCERRQLAGDLVRLRALVALDVSCVPGILVGDLAPLASLGSLKIAKFGEEPYDPFERRTAETDRMAEERLRAKMKEGFEAIAATLPGLTSLDMSYPASRIHAPYCKEALDVVRYKMRSLTSLDLSNGTFEGDDPLASLSRLKSLNISNCFGVTDAGLASLAGLSFVGLTPSSYYRVTDRGVEALRATVGTVGLYPKGMIVM
jgi:hypothetical protein